MTKSFADICLIALGLLCAFAHDLRGGSYEWIETARTFLIDAYQYPFAPEMEFDAEAIACAMKEMHVNTVRMSTMGKYATIQGTQFSTYPKQGERDLLREMIDACRPRGIRVVPYISTGHKLAWTMITQQFPEYAHQTSPGGLPSRSHMFVGEDHGTVCWNTPYRDAYLELVEHVVGNYEIDGIYFDTWRPFYFFPEPRTCYCPGCRNGFRESTGSEIPYRQNAQEYSAEEIKIIDRYHGWYQDELAGIVAKVRKIVKSHKDIPLIYNINDPVKIMSEDSRIVEKMDAFLYERGHSMLERAEGVSLARASGLAVWPYIGSYDNWPRTIHNGLDFGQEIFTTVMFGGGPIISQPVAFVEETDARAIVSEPFKVLEKHEEYYGGFENYPYVAVVYGFQDPPEHAKEGWWWKADVRSSSLGAFAACLYRHLQVSSVLETLLDSPEELAKYKVLYLASIPHLSAERVQNIKAFVERGGGLLVSYSSSLFDSEGIREDRFDLEELIRVRPREVTGPLDKVMKSYEAMVGGPNDLYLLVRSGSDDRLAEWSNRLVPLWFYEPVSVLEGGIQLADIVTGDDRRTILPGVVLSKYGKGRTAYLSSTLESLFLGSNIKELADLIATLISVVSTQPQPFHLEGPDGLIANMTVKGDTRVIHLANWTGNKFERRWVSEYYVAPVSNVRLRIRIPNGREVIGVEPLVGGSPVEIDVDGDWLEVLIPRVDAYQAIAVKYGAGS